MFVPPGMDCSGVSLYILWKHVPDARQPYLIIKGRRLTFASGCFFPDHGLADDLDPGLHGPFLPFLLFRGFYCDYGSVPCF